MSKQPTWQNAEYIHIEIPHCPHCGATKFKTVRCEVGGDGSRSRKSICSGCSKRVILVFEMPEEQSSDTAAPWQ